MFYAIKYAYGKTVVNNGTRADVVYEFSRRALRDAWIAAGPPSFNDSDYREQASARTPLVRKADWRADGDSEAWEIVARERVRLTPALAQHKHIIFADWPEAGHARWVATEPERKIIEWAKSVVEAAA